MKADYSNTVDGTTDLFLTSEEIEFQHRMIKQKKYILNSLPLMNDYNWTKDVRKVAHSGEMNFHCEMMVNEDRNPHQTVQEKCPSALSLLRFHSEDLHL